MLGPLQLPRQRFGRFTRLGTGKTRRANRTSLLYDTSMCFRNTLLLGDRRAQDVALLGMLVCVQLRWGVSHCPGARLQPGAFRHSRRALCSTERRSRFAATNLLRYRVHTLRDSAACECCQHNRGSNPPIRCAHVVTSRQRCAHPVAYRVSVCELPSSSECCM